MLSITACARYEPTFPLSLVSARRQRLALVNQGGFTEMEFRSVCEVLK